jgi:hypothetical protein
VTTITVLNVLKEDADGPTYPSVIALLTLKSAQPTVGLTKTTRLVASAMVSKMPPKEPSEDNRSVSLPLPIAKMRKEEARSFKAGRRDRFTNTTALRRLLAGQVTIPHKQEC